VVNNNAAALVLAVTVLARGKEVVISRGELIEIGDRFRLPDLLESTGARLREVGTRARKQIEALLGTRVYLDLHVKIAKDWQRNPKQLRRLGFYD
jgi:seryl-tRNA(Sec) selenium transferase